MLVSMRAYASAPTACPSAGSDMAMSRMPMALSTSRNHVLCFMLSRLTHSSTPPSSSGDDGIDLRLDQPVRVDEPAHLHDRVDRAYVAKKLAVDFGHCPPVLDANQQDARADHVVQRHSQLLQRAAG